MPPRPLRPKNDSSVPEGSDAAGDGKGGKRKAVSSACIPCRKRKSKCDGQLPSCSTCIAVYRTECSYDADTDFKRKGPVKREPQASPQHDASEVIVAHLKSLPEADSINLLQILRTEPNLDSVADSLRVNRLATLASSRDESPHQLPRDQSERKDDALLQPFTEPSASTGAISWLRVPQDTEFVEHLLELYACWIQPFYTFVSWDHFIHDLQHGRSDFCSSLLLNAILSFACHYSDRSPARTDPTNSTTAGDHFYAEAKRLLDQSDASSLTTVQALGVMSVRETSAGRDSNGYQLAGRCVRMALELGLHLSVIRQGLRAPEAEVRKTTFWAVFNLETMCAVNFGRLSQLPSSSADIEAPTIAPQDELQKWRPYEDTNLSLSATAEQPARSSLFRTHLSKLSLLASDMVNTFYAPRERFTSRRLAATYAQYREWYRDLPDAFRLENSSLPHVLVLHMYYYGCVLHLFRPYIKYDLRAAELFPRDTCTFCANEISALMNALRALYGLRRVTLAVVNLLLSASTIHLLNLPAEPAAAHLSQGLQDLEAISTNHRFAARAVNIIRSLSTKWKISLPKGAAAIAVYRSLEPQQMQYPPESTFFAASIDRKHSSEGRERSGEGIQEPFAPPVHRASGAIRLNSIPSFSSDPATPVDLQQAQNAIWTPFPGQVMPLQLREFTHPMVDFGGVDSSQQPQTQHQVWSQDREMVDEPHEYHGGQGPGAGQLDEEMEGVSDWHWQS